MSPPHDLDAQSLDGRVLAYVARGPTRFACIAAEIGAPPREIDRAIQRLRKDGLIEMYGLPRRWHITEAGKASLKESA
jgi:DNA-binding Lrp family transcriptional regulator